MGSGLAMMVRAAIAVLGAAVLLGVMALAQPAHAQAYPQASYDPDIPTMETALGFARGEQIASVPQIESYMAALEAAAPDRMEIRDYATSWQGRTLSYAIISSPENMARLDEIKANLAELAAGADLSNSARDELIGETPAVVWLSHGVHGDEISPTDSALVLAYHLLAAQEDELVNTILENTIVIVDPTQNPDGRARFIHSFYSSLGLEPLSDRYTAEHDQPWPRGRFNHYLFDLNRDWFSMTQPETRGKVAALLDWNPVVFVDAHEMGGDTTYYFPPPADPINPNITEEQRQRQDEMGRNRAAYFDRFGVAYFTREVFDAFYPGYGDMWPTLNGALAKTFEQSSARGLLFDRRNGELLTFAEGVRNNFLALLATTESVARDKDAYLRGYADYRRSAVTDGQGSDERYIVMDLSQRRWQAETLARRLVAQGIAVSRLEGRQSLCGETYPDGALVVDSAQPQGRLINTLLSDSIPLPEDFVEEQESRRARGLNHELYDVTAWSLPLMDGVATDACRRVDLSGATAVSADAPISATAPAAGQFGYAVPWSDTGQAKLVIAALRAGLAGKSTSDPFTQNGRVFPMGTVVFPTAGNPDDFEATLRGLAGEIGAELVPMETSWVEDGPNFGSSSFTTLMAPKIAMGWGDGTSPTSAGNTRFVIERQLGLPVSPIRLSTLSAADLGDYDVLVLPEDGWGFSRALGEGGVSAITEFVREGGVLVSVGSATAQLAGEDFGLLSTQLENAFTEAEASEEEEGPAPGLRIEDDAAYEALIADGEARPEDVPGVLVRVEADPDHWLASGYDGATALVTGRQIFRPLNEGDGTNVFRFAGPDDLLQSGYLWEENRLQLAYKPFLMAERQGDGMVVAFTQSPTTRAYLGGLNLLLANAVFLAPAHAR